MGTGRNPALQMTSLTKEQRGHELVISNFRISYLLVGVVCEDLVPLDVRQRHLFEGAGRVNDIKNVRVRNRVKEGLCFMFRSAKSEGQVG